MVCRVSPAILDILGGKVALVTIGLVDASGVAIVVLAAYRDQCSVAEIDVVAGIDGGAVESPGVGLPLPGASKVLEDKVGGSVVTTPGVLVAGVGGLGGAHDGSQEEGKGSKEHLFRYVKIPAADLRLLEPTYAVREYGVPIGV